MAAVTRAWINKKGARPGEKEERRLLDAETDLIDRSSCRWFHRDTESGQTEQFLDLYYSVREIGELFYWILDHFVNLIF